MASGSIDWSQEIRELRGSLNKYRPGTESKFPAGMPQRKDLLIGLFGITGCGKTSLINSLKFAAMGSLPKKRLLPTAPHDKIGGHTMLRKWAHIIESIYVVDNRGLDEINANTMDSVKQQLDGKRAFTEKVIWEEPLKPITDLDDDKDWKRQIGCAVLVYSAKQSLRKNTQHLAQFVNLLHIKQGIYPIAVITNIDKVNESSVEELKTNLYASGIDHVFEVANLTKEKTKLEGKYQYNLLSFLDQCTAYGDEIYIFKYLEQQEKERQKRSEEKRRQRQREEEERRREEKERQERAEEKRKQRQREEEERRRLNALKYTGTTGGGALAGAGVGLAVGGPIGALIGAGIGAATGAGIGKATE